MDQFMVDITNIKNVLPYSEVTIIGKGQTATDMSNLLNTISYEVVCAISPRVYRVYVKR